MIKNISQTERIVRIVLAIILVALDYFKIVTGEFNWILLAFAAILFVTALVSFCPLYKLIGKNNPETK